jgi:hypothetical protein
MLMRDNNFSLGVYIYTQLYTLEMFASPLSIYLQRRLWKHISQSFLERLNETHFQNLQISTIVYN